MDEAISLAKRAVDTSPTFSPALAAYGYALAINGRPQEGIEYLVKSTEANPRISRNFIQLAQVYRANKNFTEAINNQKVAISKVDEDNTLVGPEEKKVAKARYTYDLAKTYDMAKINVDIVPLLTQASEINPKIKNVIKNDHEKYGFFTASAEDPAFQSLIN
jgi:tetratricopeptide (TPR) repeat protein